MRQFIVCRWTPIYNQIMDRQQWILNSQVLLKIPNDLPIDVWHKFNIPNLGRTVLSALWTTGCVQNQWHSESNNALINVSLNSKMQFKYGQFQAHLVWHPVKKLGKSFWGVWGISQYQFYLQEFKPLVLIT